ncbi:hypothetical protein SAMN05421741_11361 [Paenimyroides ummariense]|uniref:Uncharacterized protein n=1 Tax=Paenimyroides ummariense TaxID=913024 RepID=A0A1I5CUZ4_9FLAO|nr:hypothetical protein SAMN05421741_11361 [Paenimyroides ummariense]
MKINKFFATIKCLRFLYLNQLITRRCQLSFLPFKTLLTIEFKVIIKFLVNLRIPDFSSSYQFVLSVTLKSLFLNNNLQLHFFKDKGKLYNLPQTVEAGEEMSILAFVYIYLLDL